MREIKFRAWDKDLEEMVYTGYCIDLDGNFYVRPRHAPAYIPDESDGGPFILMQYTGLKDKSGKEIYEGDIDLNFGVMTWNEETGNELYGWCWKDLENKKLHNIEYLTLEWEIIGNIYENRELLEKTDD